MPQQELLAFDNDRKLRQRPLDAGHEPRQVGQFSLERRRRNSRRQQLCQPPSRGHFLEIEISQPPHFAGRHDQAAPVPTPNDRDRHAQQIGKHGRRIEPPHALFPFDQAQPLPELGLGNDFQLARFGAAALQVVEQGVNDTVGREQFVLAHHDQIDRGVQQLGNDCPLSPDQLLGLSARHAAELADECHASFGQRTLHSRIRHRECHLCNESNDSNQRAVGFIPTVYQFVVSPIA